MTTPDLCSFWVLSTEEQNAIREAHPDCTKEEHRAFLNAFYDLGETGIHPSKRVDASGRHTARVIGKDLYCPLLVEEVCFCDVCDDLATWKCYPQDVLTATIALCDQCKEERMRPKPSILPRFEDVGTFLLGFVIGLHIVAFLNNFLLLYVLFHVALAAISAYLLFTWLKS